MFARPLKTKKDSLDPKTLHKHALTSINFSHIKHPKAIDYYTDGSRLEINKNKFHTGAGFYRPQSLNNARIKHSARCSDNIGITSVELMAIRLALLDYLYVIDNHHEYDHIIIHTDSISALFALANRWPKNDTKILYDIFNIGSHIFEQKNTKIILNWIPSHSDILGNNIADSLAVIGAKSALSPICIPQTLSLRKKHHKLIIRDRWHYRLKMTKVFTTSWWLDNTNCKWFNHLEKTNRELEKSIIQIRMSYRLSTVVINDAVQQCTHCGENYTSPHYLTCAYGKQFRVQANFHNIINESLFSGQNYNFAVEFMRADAKLNYKYLIKYMALFPPQNFQNNHLYILAMRPLIMLNRALYSN